MEWYWWVLIVIAAGVIGYLKTRIWQAMLKKRAEKNAAETDDF